MSDRQPPTLGKALRRLIRGLSMILLVVLQWPFKAVSDALDRPIDVLHKEIDRDLGPK